MLILCNKILENFLSYNFTAFVPFLEKSHDFRYGGLLFCWAHLLLLPIVQNKIQRERFSLKVKSSVKRAKNVYMLLIAIKRLDMKLGFWLVKMEKFD